jgi:hypothetical protein
VRAAWLFAIAACGNDRAPVSGVDSASADGTQPPDAPAGCSYAEQDDLLNDLTLGNGTAEVTQLTLADTLVICGRVDNQHLIEDRVDVDAFQITLADRTELRVDFAGAASALANLEVTVLDATNVVVERGRFLGTHVAFQTTLAAGDYRLVVTATNTSDLAAGFDYKLRAIASPAACARVTATAAYVEAADGPQSTGNDMIEIRYANGERTLTTANSDDPEPSGIIATADLRLTGQSADVAGPDDFRDRDTYLFETGAHDELAVRVDWTGDADLDVFVFPEGAVAEIGRGTTVGKTAPEHAVFPVLANTRYWLWVGAYDSSTVQVDYDVTLCPTTF